MRAASSGGNGAHGASRVSSDVVSASTSTASVGTNLVPRSPAAGCSASSSAATSSGSDGIRSALRTASTSGPRRVAGSDSATTTRDDGAFTRAQCTPGCASTALSTRRATAAPSSPCTPCTSM